MIKQYIRYMYILIIMCMSGLIVVRMSDSKISPNIIQGMWIFEEGKGETVKDLSGNDSDGVFVGDIKWVEGKFGGGIEFTGVEAQNHVRFGTKGDPDSLAALNFKESKGFSIHAWVLSSVPPNGKCVIWKGQGCSSWSQYLLGTGAHENPGGRINQASFHYRIKSSPDKFEALGDPLPVNEWVHLVGVWDGAKIYIYVNGKLQNSADAVGQPWDSPEAVFIGSDIGCNAGKGRCHWAGIIDEVVIFNMPLTKDQVVYLGNGIEGVLAVNAAGKTTTTWGKLKSIN